MRKVIKLYGNSLVVVLNVEDAMAYDLKEGDIINIEIEKVKKKKE